MTHMPRSLWSPHSPSKSPQSWQHFRPWREKKLPLKEIQKRKVCNSLSTIHSVFCEKKASGRFRKHLPTCATRTTTRSLMWTSSNVGFSHEIGWSNLPPVWQNPCIWSLRARGFSKFASSPKSSTFFFRTLAVKDIQGIRHTLTQQAQYAVTHLLYVVFRFFPSSLKLSLLWWCREEGCSCWITTLVPSTIRGRFDPMSPPTQKAFQCKHHQNAVLAGKICTLQPMRWYQGFWLCQALFFKR